MHCWDQRSYRGQPGVNLLRKGLLPPHLVGRTPVHSVILHCGISSYKGQSGPTRGQFAQNWSMPANLTRINPSPEYNALLRSKVMQGSAGVR